MRVQTLLLFFIAFSESLAYYGLSLSTELLPGDRFINFLLSGAVEAPAYAANAFLLDRWGRRKLQIISNVISAGTFILLAFVPTISSTTSSDLTSLHLAVAMVGKFSFTSAYGILYFYAQEIYPTQLRSTGTGLCALVGRTSAMVSPFLIYLNDLSPMAQPLTFAVLAILTTVALCFLPETRNRKLPQTLEDLDVIYGKHGKRQGEEKHREEKHNKHHEHGLVTSTSSTPLSDEEPLLRTKKNSRYGTLTFYETD